MKSILLVHGLPPIATAITGAGIAESCFLINLKGPCCLGFLENLERRLNILSIIPVLLTRGLSLVL